MLVGFSFGGMASTQALALNWLMQFVQLAITNNKGSTAIEGTFPIQVFDNIGGSDSSSKAASLLMCCPRLEVLNDGIWAWDFRRSITQ